MLLTIESGRGYLTADGRDEPSIGVIPIDAIFTPIRRVNYRVEKTRVGARTDYDKLMLEIQTDGSIGPKEALAQAAQILIEQFSIFAQLGGAIPRPDKAVIGPNNIPSRLQDMPIEVLDLSSRTYNCLKRSQITTVGQLLQMSEEELLGLRNFGQKSLVELHEKLAQHGIITPEEGAARAASAAAYADGSDDDDDSYMEFDDNDDKDDNDDRGSGARARRGGRRPGYDNDDDL